MMHGHEKSDSVIVAVKPANTVAPHCGAVRGGVSRSGAGGAKGGDQGKCGRARAPRSRDLANPSLAVVFLHFCTSVDGATSSVDSLWTHPGDEGQRYASLLWYRDPEHLRARQHDIGGAGVIRRCARGARWREFAGLVRRNDFQKRSSSSRLLIFSITRTVKASGASSLAGFSLETVGRVVTPCQRHSNHRSTTKYQIDGEDESQSPGGCRRQSDH